MVTDKQFDNLVDICQSLADSAESLVVKVHNLESIARYQESKIEKLEHLVNELWSASGGS